MTSSKYDDFHLLCSGDTQLTFLQAALGGSWLLLATFGAFLGASWLLSAPGSCWVLLVALGGSWWLLLVPVPPLAAPGGSWGSLPLLDAPGGSWGLLPAPGFLAAPGGSWGVRVALATPTS